jgi:hypothetical protein
VLWREIGAPAVFVRPVRLCFETSGKGCAIGGVLGLPRCVSKNWVARRAAIAYVRRQTFLFAENMRSFFWLRRVQRHRGMRFSWIVFLFRLEVACSKVRVLRDLVGVGLELRSIGQQTAAIGQVERIPDDNIECAKMVAAVGKLALLALEQLGVDAVELNECLTGHTQSE